MSIFENTSIHIAGEQDIATIVSLLNKGYRGEQSRKGWTTEADLIAGEIRSHEEDVKQVMRTVGSVFLKYEDETGTILGCVNLKKQGDRIYLGMFAVDPELQGGGIGGALLKAAEEYGRSIGIGLIYMYVISVRDELVAWYTRKGYQDTGERVPFEENFTGKHLRPLEFAVLEKEI